MHSVKGLGAGVEYCLLPDSKHGWGDLLDGFSAEGGVAYCTPEVSN